MHWTRETPFEVGNAASFTNGFTSLSLAQHFDKTARMCCTNRDADESPAGAARRSACSAVAQNPSVSTGCFARLLTTDFQLRSDADQYAKTASPAMTIEGWVKINTAAGGVVLSTGRAAGKTCTIKGSCQVALIYVKVNATHVTVGHETAQDDAGMNWKLNTVDFSIASSAPLLEQLTDAGFYLNSNGDPSLVGKFVHVAVVRKSMVGSSHKKGCEPSATADCTARKEDLHEREFWFSTYKVYVNGYVHFALTCCRQLSFYRTHCARHVLSACALLADVRLACRFMLEVAKFPFCGAGSTCTNGARYGGYADRSIVQTGGCYKAGTSVDDMTTDNGCKVELTIGESNPVPGPRRATADGDLVPADDTSGRCYLPSNQGSCRDNFGNETALLFGAYRGAAGRGDSYFDGSVSSPLTLPVTFPVRLLLLACLLGTVIC